MKEFCITDVADQAMFIAQAGHESRSFSSVVEDLDFTPDVLISLFGEYITPQQANALGRTERQLARHDAIANLVYAYRFGNKARGDGWRYRGRGLIKIVGLDNYIEFASEEVAGKRLIL